MYYTTESLNQGIVIARIVIVNSDYEHHRRERREMIIICDSTVSSSPLESKLVTRARNKLWETSQCNVPDKNVKGIPCL